MRLVIWLYLNSLPFYYLWFTMRSKPCCQIFCVLATMLQRQCGNKSEHYTEHLKVYCNVYLVGENTVCKIAVSVYKIRWETWKKTQKHSPEADQTTCFATVYILKPNVGVY